MIVETERISLVEDNDEDQSYWQVDDFDFKECLGNGKFGYVYRAIEKQSGKVLAIKLINKNIVSQYDFFEQLKQEIEIHSRLR